jgi:hypothetical protein
MICQLGCVIAKVCLKKGLVCFGSSSEILPKTVQRAGDDLTLEDGEYWVKAEIDGSLGSYDKKRGKSLRVFRHAT